MGFSICNLLLFLLMCADSASSQVHFYITPSPNVHCPRDPCLTLSQLAANSISYLCSETNVSLSFQPGNHSLEGELSLSQADNFSMTKDKGVNGTVFVECGSQSGRINISETIFAMIKDLHFIGCGGNRVSQVEQFIVEDTIFEGMEGRGTALTLNEVTDASIVRSSFLSNTHHHGSTFKHDHGISITSTIQDTLKYVYVNQNPLLAVGGALYIAFSDVSVVSSKFTNNTAEIGGALFAHSSCLHIAGNIYSFNKADFGGVMITSESLVDIKSSTFSENAAVLHGGVMIAYGDLFSIDNTTFTSNSAGGSSGVMMTYESVFSITDSTFSGNTAKWFSGVIYAGNCSFTISSCNFTINSAALSGGVMYTFQNSLFDISSSTFTNNSAAATGGVVLTFQDSSFNITSSNFTNNSAAAGGVIFTYRDSSFNITSSTFTNNGATDAGGGVMYTLELSFYITNSNFTKNRAAGHGGVMHTFPYSSFNIISSTFTDNSAAGPGGVMATSASSFDITSSIFAYNSAPKTNGGVMIVFSSLFCITSSTFTNNNAAEFGGVVDTLDSSFNITNSTFTNNSATSEGGVIVTDHSPFNITSSTFTNNSADAGGVISTFGSSIDITSGTFTSNSAASIGGIMFTLVSLVNITSSTFTNSSAADGGVAYASTSSFSIISSSFYSNKADGSGGIMIAFECSIDTTDSLFDHNLGSLYIFNSNLTFRGYTRFENCKEPSHKKVRTSNITTTTTVTVPTQLRPEGGAITSFQSTVIFTGVSNLSNNQARSGGAILATESKIMIYSETTIANNTATDNSGGSISLQQSDFEVRGNCIISGNDAMRGGGIHAASSTISVYQPRTLHIMNNKAENGSGLYLEASAKLYVLKHMSTRAKSEHLLIFQDNHANYGGAIFAADDTNSDACSSHNECFIQTLALYQLHTPRILNDILFSGNTASEQGANLFGGLLDRCIPSPFAEVYRQNLITPPQYSGVSYLGNISNIASLNTITSLPIRICFCKNESEPDCSYKPPIIKVKKGESFPVQLVAVDQVNHSVDANIISSLSSQEGGFSEGQQTQSVRKNCSNVIYNVFSPHISETINLYADGPCGSSTLSTQYLHIQFIDCICPIGFQRLNSDTRCQCDCDSKLSPHITEYNSTTESLVRVNTNSWITHINDTDPPGYVIHPNCPFDYCRPPTENVNMNLKFPNGSDAQCAYNHSGVLFGACQEHLSLSLGSSRCLFCHSRWPAVLVVILLASIIAGILLVTALLALNMTVAVGLINSFIVYANIVAANSAVFFPLSEPSFPTVFVAWLNLDVGIDVCFFDGLDAYTKTWLQLAFPVYIISLVILIIIVSEYSPRFARLIGKRDPIATLATLILLSYAKLLSVTITALSFAVLDYPDGSQESVWLPDGNVPYFQGKHVALVLMALLIILVGVPYTILLFLWQWLIRLPRWKIFTWTRNTKLNAFVSVYHAPYNSKYRYWTGLLLLVRVVLYITASIATSYSERPQTSLLVTNILVGGLFFLNGITGFRTYRNSMVDVLETGMYLNLLVFAAFSLYDFKTDITKQTAVAYTSTIITFILLVGVIIYHVYLLVRKNRPHEEEVIMNEYPLVPVQPVAKPEVTHSVIEITRPRDQSPPPQAKLSIGVIEVTSQYYQ